MLVLLLCVAINIIQLSLQENSDCNITFKKHIQNVTFQRIRIDAFSPTARPSLKYNISFKADKCCPVVEFATGDSLGPPTHRDPRLHCYQMNFQNIALLSRYHLHLSEWNPYSGCIRRGSYYICTGIRNFYVGTDVKWYIDVGYECRIKQMIDIRIDIQFMCGTQSKCETLGSNFCKDVYNYSQTSFPNSLGQLTQIEAVKTLQSALLAFDKHIPCYKYTGEFMCYSLFPPCVNGKAMLPCRQTCIEVTKRCEHYLKLYKQPLYCGKYPLSLDPDVCFYEPIVCPIEEGPEFGTTVL